MHYGYLRDSKQNKEHLNRQIKEIGPVDVLVIEEHGEKDFLNLLKDLKVGDSLSLSDGSRFPHSHSLYKETALVLLEKDINLYLKGIKYPYIKELNYALGNIPLEETDNKEVALKIKINIQPGQILSEQVKKQKS